MVCTIEYENVKHTHDLSKGNLKDIIIGKSLPDALFPKKKLCDEIQKNFKEKYYKKLLKEYVLKKIDLDSDEVFKEEFLNFNLRDKEYKDIKEILEKKNTCGLEWNYASFADLNNHPQQFGFLEDIFCCNLIVIPLLANYFKVSINDKNIYEGKFTLNISDTNIMDVLLNFDKSSNKIQGNLKLDLFSLKKSTNFIISIYSRNLRKTKIIVKMKDDSIIINYEKAILDSLLANNEKFYINSYNNQKEKINLHKKKRYHLLE